MVIFLICCRISDPFTEIPADMLLFHICIPFAIEHFRPKATIKTVLLYWFTWVGWALGLSDFLLPPVEEANDQGGGEVAVHGFDEVQPAVPVENAEELEIDHQNDADE
jgi:E3 ubiquitin-protein ligase MARCH6